MFQSDVSTDFVFRFVFLMKTRFAAGASWDHTAETTPVKTVGSVSTVWTVQCVSVTQASRETGNSVTRLTQALTSQYQQIFVPKRPRPVRPGA